MLEKIKIIRRLEDKVEERNLSKNNTKVNKIFKNNERKIKKNKRISPQELQRERTEKLKSRKKLRNIFFKVPKLKDIQF